VQTPLKWQTVFLIPPLAALLLLACQVEPPADDAIGAQGNAPATKVTILANAKV
jgi:hypothetical protein